MIGWRRLRSASAPRTDPRSKCWSPILASEAGIDAVAERAAAAPLDLVINNAGMGGYRRFVELEPKVADALIAVHIRAVVRVTLAALPGMVERKRGGVINVASLLAFSGASTDAFLPKRVVYAGAKAFLVTFTQTLANELPDTGVRVQVCLPGVIKTEFHEVQGMDLSKMPRMTPDDLARASLAGLRLGEVVCVPALEERRRAANRRGEPDGAGGCALDHHRRPLPLSREPGYGGLSQAMSAGNATAASVPVPVQAGPGPAAGTRRHRSMRPCRPSSSQRSRISQRSPLGCRRSA